VIRSIRFVEKEAIFIFRFKSTKGFNFFEITASDK